MNKDFEVKKTRDISLVELYSNLQLEFISYFVRKKIYCKEFIENYGKISSQKREKIEVISSKNSLPSIFNDEPTKEKFINKFLNKTGIPNFTYKNEEIKQKMEKWDAWYYFSKGISIKFVKSGELFLGIITNNDRFNRIISVKDEFGEEHQIDYNDASRIFSEGFFNF